ncbi:hypothetical protein Patl1_25633 [Pistacia atlantica]|uniref:Uncharacterized protein n=1 Tax=Pistacia atlantica TaxID=434234 RepID=A0ACC1AYW6_9ROSI|nr:hypothetical protein Patl1_25633 [Pistacia atlantica]
MQYTQTLTSLDFLIDVKKIIECTTNYSSDEWDLFDGRTRLKNTKTLPYYHIKKNDQLKMMVAVYQIFISFGGRTLEDDKSLAFYCIEEEFTLRDLIIRPELHRIETRLCEMEDLLRERGAQLHAKEGITEDIEDIFSGGRLQDDRRQVDHSIQWDSNLQLPKSHCHEAICENAFNLENHFG